MSNEEFTFELIMFNDEITFEITTAVAQALLEAGAEPSASEQSASNPITSEPSASGPSASGVSSVCGNSSLNTSLSASPYKKDDGRIYINSGGEILFNGVLWNGNGKFFSYYINGVRSDYYTYMKKIYRSHKDLKYYIITIT